MDPVFAGVKTAFISLYTSTEILGRPKERVSLLVMSDSVTLWTRAQQSPLSMDFSRQVDCYALLQRFSSSHFKKSKEVDFHPKYQNRVSMCN